MRKKISLFFFLVVSLLNIAGCNFMKGINSNQIATKPIVGYANISDTDVFCMNIKKKFDEKVNHHHPSNGWFAQPCKGPILAESQDSLNSPPTA